MESHSKQGGKHAQYYLYAATTRIAGLEEVGQSGQQSEQPGQRQQSGQSQQAGQSEQAGQSQQAEPSQQRQQSQSAGEQFAAQHERSAQTNEVGDAGMPAFDEIDEDSGGFVTREEFDDVVADAEFGRADANRDGWLSRSEYRTAYSDELSREPSHASD